MTAQQAVFSLSLLCMHDFCSSRLEIGGGGETPQASTEPLLTLVLALIYTEPCCDEGLSRSAPAKGNSERRAKGLFLWFCSQKFVLFGLSSKPCCLPKGNLLCLN